MNNYDKELKWFNVLIIEGSVSTEIVFLAPAVDILGGDSVVQYWSNITLKSILLKLYKCMFVVIAN